MITVDIHTHIIPPKLPSFKKQFGYGGFIELKPHSGCEADMIFDDGRFFRRIEKNAWEPAARLEDCDRAGVHVQVLSTIPVLFSYWAKPQDAAHLCRFLNDHIATVVQAHPKRFVGLGTLPLQAPDLAARELERCVKTLGLSGFEMGTHINGWNLDAPELFPVFQLASDLGAAIFIHPWDMMGSDRMPKYWLPWLVGMPAELSLALCSLIFGGVFERLPDLKIAFAHGGGSFGATLGRIEKAFLARPDLVAVDNPHNPRKYLGRFFVDSLVHDRAVLEHSISLFGEESIALGTDYPFPLGESVPGELIMAGKFSKQATECLMGKNALRLLGRSESDFL